MGGRGGGGLGLCISVNSKVILSFPSTVKWLENHVWVIVDMFVFVNVLKYSFAITLLGAMIVKFTVMLEPTTLNLILDLRNWDSNIVTNVD